MGTLQRELSSLTAQLNDNQQQLNRLTAQKDQVRDIVRDEFSERLVMLEDENGRLKREASEGRARHKLELQTTKSQHDEELKAIQERVKAAIARKEESVRG